MDVTLPNGKVISGIPDGTNKWTIMEKAINAGIATPEDFGEQSYQAQPTTTEKLARQGAMVPRYVTQGALALPGLLADIPAAAMNAGISGYEKLTGQESGYRFPSQNQLISRTLTKAGMPEPQGIPEKAAQFGSEILSGGLTAGPVNAAASRIAGVSDEAVAAVPRVQSLGAGLARRVGIGRRAAEDLTTLGARPNYPTMAAPTIDALREQARQAYKAADEAGASIENTRVQSFLAGLRDQLRSAGFRAKIHPRVDDALDSIEAASKAGPLSIQEAEIQRRIASNARGSIQADERRIGRMLVDAWDEFIGKELSQSGNQAAGHSLSQARSAWSSVRKAELVERLLSRAHDRASQFSGSGLENAIRTEFRSLVRNDKIMRTFTPSEQEALRLVANGDTMGNIYRALGRFAPRGVVSTMLGGGAGYMAGGSPGAALLLGAGEVGRATATRSTLRNAQLASELMRRGPSLVNRPPSQLAAAVPGSTAALAERLRSQ